MTNKFDETIQNIDTIMEEFVTFQKKMQEQMQEKFQVLFSAFFEAYPMIKTVHWHQYTPYFNDGDECTFTLGEVYFSTTEWEDIENHYGEDDDGNMDSYEGPKIPENIKSAMDKLSAIINNNDEILRVMFDNYVWVRAHSGGFEIEECEAPY